MKFEGGVSINRVIAELTKSTHGNLKSYVPMGKAIAQEDPDFLAHLIAWNEQNGQIRDSKVALPIIALMGPLPTAEIMDNALAHLAKLDPRNFLKALQFGREAGLGHTRQLRKLVTAYLRARENNWGWWERTALQHRDTLKSLYATYHIKPSALVDMILFKKEYPAGTVFDKVKNLKNMSNEEAAGTIITQKIPFLVAAGALGEKLKDESLVVALINAMSPTELVTNTKMLEKLGLKTNPTVKGAYAKALEKAAESKKATFKTTRAAEAVEDATIKAKLQGLQEKQIAKLGSVDGNWLILGDKSGSMSACIETARQVAGVLAKMVSGKVHLVFFDVGVRYFDVTGKTYDEIKAVTKGITANGGTSIGRGLDYVMVNNLDVDGIAVVSDGGENTQPFFHDTYRKFSEKVGKEVPVYFYHINDGYHQDAFSGYMSRAGHDLQIFPLGAPASVDYYSLPNIIQTMRTNKYSLVDDIMAVPLLSTDAVLTR